MFFSAKCNSGRIAILLISYQAQFRLSVYKNPAVNLSDAKNVFLNDTRVRFPDSLLFSAIYIETGYFSCHISWQLGCVGFIFHIK